MSSESRSENASKPPEQDASTKPGERGNLIVVSAPSGAGKSSLAERALKRIHGLKFSVSYTTREPRGTEKDGVDYHFVSDDEFRAMKDRGEFLESAEVHGYRYATHREAVDKLLAEGLDVILDIDVQGAEQVRDRVTEAITVFILPPSREILEARLRSRNLNEPRDLERRLRNAAVEVKLYEKFDYVIVNDDIDRALASLEAIITAERSRLSRQRTYLESIVNTFGGE
ncbi:MAG TPA: guanylate kinase [Blastocatellia bacterium]|jgi:guanylate kinase|nr:guanylate kinase [Blastocatellia bacterium]